MTKQRKLRILWDLLTIAVGLDTLFTREWIMSKKNHWDSTQYIPKGMCVLMHRVGISLYERKRLINFLRQYRIDHGAYYFKIADWKIRSEVLLKAIEDLSTKPPIK